MSHVEVAQAAVDDPEVGVQEVSTTIVQEAPCFQFRKTKLARFLPAIMTCCVWLYVVTFNHGQLGKNNVFVDGAPGIGALWNELWNQQTQYYAMSIAMVFGSMIAGSTPLGGGVVAFPIAVLVIGLNPNQGRDFTCIIQAVGMNAAAYMIAIVKPHLLDFNLIACFTFMGIPGMLMAFSLDLSPFYIILTFQILVLEFGVIYFYLNVLSPKVDGAITSTGIYSPSSPTKKPQPGTAIPPVPNNSREYMAYALMVIAAFIGGFFSGNCGSGADIMLYVFGVLGWNFLMPHKAYPESVLTGSSVVTMGLLSLVGTLCRGMTRQITSEVYLCWGATVWIVCWGAPIGSLLLTPSLQAYLRIVFYVLAIAQFAGFAVIKIKGNTDAWIIFTVVSVLVLVGLVLHRIFKSRKIRANGDTPTGLQPSYLLRRMLAA
jgi:hypothetical protein